MLIKNIETNFNSSLWEKIESDLSLNLKAEKVFCRDDRGTRVYILDDEVWKVQLKDPSFQENPFFSDLREEAKHTRFASNLPGVVKVIRFISDDKISILILERVNGERLDFHKFSAFNTIRIIGKLLYKTALLSRRRILHGDLNIHNFIVTNEGKLVLIDFGMAQVASIWKCITYNFFCRGNLDGKKTFPISGTIVRCIEFTLPKSAQKYFRKIVRIAPYVNN
jgi:serine/threonine protein kinase